MPNLNPHACSGALRLVTSFILALSSFSGVSQDHRISISPTYNIPIGELSWSYAPGIGADLNYSSIRQEKKNGPLRSQGISVGYIVLPPLADTLYYVVDKGGQGATGHGAGIGIALYEPFRMFHVDATMDWGIPLNKNVYFTPGAHIGVLYGKRAVTFEDSFGGADGMDEFVTWAALSPQVGMEYRFTDHLSTTVFVGYTFIIQLGQTNAQAMDYNENTGMFYHFYSPGLSLNFNF